MDEFGWRTIAGGSDSRPGTRRCAFECLAVTTAASGLCDRATKAPSTRGPRRWVWMLQIVVCSTAERAIGLPVRPDVHNAAERDRSAGSGRARQPMRRSRPCQPCSFCGRRCGSLGRRRLREGARHRSVRTSIKQRWKVVQCGQAGASARGGRLPSGSLPTGSLPYLGIGLH
jgi:hypothetical protein